MFMKKGLLTIWMESRLIIMMGRVAGFQLMLRIPQKVAEIAAANKKTDLFVGGI